MHATEELTLTISESVLEIVRALVATGKYENESDVFEQAIIDSITSPAPQEVDHAYLSDDWIREHVLPALREMENDPSSAITSEQMRESIRLERAAQS